MREKCIVIVAPEKYDGIARQAAHHISKVDGVTASYWSIKQYKDNEFNLAGQQYVLFLGAKDENELVADYADVIPVKYSDAGIMCGFDGAKALCFGDGKLAQEEAFEKWATVGTGATILAGGTIARALAGVLLAPILGVPLIVFTAISTALVGKKIRDERKRKELQHRQTAAAVTVFTETYLRSWLGLPEEG